MEALTLSGGKVELQDRSFSGDLTPYDGIYIFPSALENPRWQKPEIGGTSFWVLLLPPESSLEEGKKWMERGFSMVLPLSSPPWVFSVPLLHHRYGQKIIFELNHLLKETLELHDILGILEQVRNLLPLLNSPAFYTQLLQTVLPFFQADQGAIWVREEEGDTFQKRWQTPHFSGNPEKTLDLRHLPLTSLTRGEPAFHTTSEVTMAYLPFREAGEVVGIVAIERETPFFHRELENLKVLSAWVSPLIRIQEAGPKKLPTERERGGEILKFPERVEHLLKLARRYERPLSTVWIWGGKKMMDRTFLPAILEKTLRDADVVGEYDGEKIPIALPETGYMGAEYLVRRIEREIRRVKPLEGTGIYLTFTTTPFHGLLWEDIEMTHRQMYREILELYEVWKGVTPPVEEGLSLLLHSSRTVPLDDPNLWMDYLFHLLQEISFIHPSESRLLIHLTDPKKLLPFLSPIKEFPIPWERILLTGNEPLEEESLPLYPVETRSRDPLYLLVHDTPFGSSLLWVLKKNAQWKGGMILNQTWGRIILDAWENQCMIRRKWA